MAFETPNHHEHQSPYDVLVSIVLIASLAVIASWAMGRDLNWDYFNYHGYAAFDPLGARLLQDFHPAGIVGYLNPLPFMPLGLMQDADLHSLVIASALAGVHSLNVLFLYLLCLALSRRVQYPRATAMAMTALGCATGAFWQQVGSSFVDPITTVPLMAALWIIARGDGEGGWKSAVLVGLLAGLSVGLKLTNAPHAVGLCVAVLVTEILRCKHRETTAREVALSLFSLGAAFTLGLLVSYGSWGWLLQQRFGSPVFPLFNELFQAPEFAIQNLAYERFVPKNALEILILPWRMMTHDSWVYGEVPLPDCRFFAIAVALIVLLLRMVLVGSTSKHRVLQGTRSIRCAIALWSFFAVSLVLWMKTSFNGRYGIPILLLAGPLFWHLILCISRESVARIALLCLLLIQGLQMVSVGNPRWTPDDWKNTWLPVNIDPAIAKKPGLFLSVTSSSESYLVRHIHPQSVFVNPIGLSPLVNDQHGWSRFLQLRDRFEGNTRVVFALPSGEESFADSVSSLDDLIDRLGLETIKDECSNVIVNKSTDNELPYIWGRPSDKDDLVRFVGICSVKRKILPDPAISEMRKRTATILDALERKCPSVFLPRQGAVDGKRMLWRRVYSRNDLYVTVDFAKDVIEYRMERQIRSAKIANLSSWQSDFEKFDCKLPFDGERGLKILDY